VRFVDCDERRTHGLAIEDLGDVCGDACVQRWNARACMTSSSAE
jgi:hypothetical protein